MKLKNFIKWFSVALAFACVIFILLIQFRANPLNNKNITNSIKAIDGCVNLNTSKYSLFKIQGSWYFAWKAFYNNIEEFSTSNFIDFPGAWTSKVETSTNGWASWGLTVKGLKANKTYALSLGQTLSACRIIINRETVYSIGSPGKSREQEKPKWGAPIILFKSDSQGRADLILQISNWHDREGGSNTPLLIGSPDSLFKAQDSQKFIDSFAFSALLTMTFFFGTLYLFRKKDFYFLWFAALCLIVGIRAYCYDTFTLLDIFPFLPWALYFRIGYLTFPFGILVFLGFLNSIYPNLLPKKIFFILSAPFFLYSIIICVFPAQISAKLLTSMQVYSVIPVIWGIVIIIKACLQKIPGCWWLLFGFSVATVFFIIDILISMWIFNGASTIHIGMIICLMCIALMVIENYSASFLKTSLFRTELETLNNSIMRFVPQKILNLLGHTTLSELRPGDSAEYEMAVMFSDIRSFTTLAEKMDSNSVISFLNSYYALIVPIVRSNGGIIVKYAGDGFTALFPDGAESAMKSASEIHKAINRHNKSHIDKNIIAGIGIDFGPVVLGVVGSQDRMDAVAFSDCTATAAFFDAQSKKFKVKTIINTALLRGLKDPQKWLLRPIDTIIYNNQDHFLFEVFSENQEKQKEAKLKTLGKYERALFAWQTEDYKKAKQLFYELYIENPDDILTKYYLKKTGLAK